MSEEDKAYLLLMKVASVTWHTRLWVGDKIQLDKSIYRVTYDPPLECAYRNLFSAMPTYVSAKDELEAFQIAQKDLREEQEAAG